MIINTTNLNEARKQINLAHRKQQDNNPSSRAGGRDRLQSSEPIIVQAQDDAFNRKIVEYGKFHVLLSLEKGHRKNKLRQVDSGLNHVLAKIATKNKISIGIDLKEIKKLSKKDKAERLARIAQNIKICRKSNTKMITINSNTREAQHLFLSLGASTKQAKEATTFFK